MKKDRSEDKENKALNMKKKTAGICRMFGFLGEVNDTINHPDSHCMHFAMRFGRNYGFRNFGF